MSGNTKSTSANVLWAMAFAAMLVPTYEALGQQTAASPRFKEYEFNQYITSTALAPSNILRLDSNGDIALAARTETTRARLKTLGIPFSESQIALLKTFRLLEEKEDTLRTSFPILGPKETQQLRQQVAAIAPALARRLEPQVRELQNELSRTGRERNAYSIIFSYVLDGLVWDEFAKRQMVHRREITVESPLWSGEVWALYPPRVFSAGTNSMCDQGVCLKVTWTKDAIPQMLPFVADIPRLERMLDDYRKGGIVKDERTRQVFGPFDLFDESGRLTIPVIDEKMSNDLYRSASAIAVGVATQVAVLLNLGGLAHEFEFSDNEQALVIAYHELMWDVMDQLEQRGLATKPTAFAAPKRAKPADIAALVFVVRKAR